MKKTGFILTLCIMTSIISYSQPKLKNGVYEFISIFDNLEPSAVSSVGIISVKSTARRTLIVKNDTILYEINNTNVRCVLGVSSGTRDNYFLKIEKHADNLYKAQNESIELIITVINRNSIEIEILSGYITNFYSGGQYFTKIVDLPPEKQTLTFVRELTADDEEKLVKNNEK